MSELHKQGWFTATIRDHGIGKSSGKGTPQIIVMFETGEGTIFGYFALTDRAAEYTIEKVRAMGFQGDNLSTLNDGATLVGNKCEIQVKHEEYNNEVRAKVGFVNPFGQQAGITRDDDAAANAKRFNALLKKAAKSPKVDGRDDGRGEPECTDDFPI